MRKFLIVVGLMICASAAIGQTAALPVYACTLPGVQSLTSGLKSSNYLQGVIPACTVTVYLTGTTTIPATTPQTPLTANINGSIPPIYAATGVGYDVTFSGGQSNPSCTTAPNCYTTPYTLTDVQVGGSGGGGGGSIIPSNAVFVFAGISVFDDDPHVLSPPIAISSYTAPVSEIVTVHTTGAHGFSIGDWVSMRFAGGWPAPTTAFPNGTLGSDFRVLSSGFSSTSFQINIGVLPGVSACSSSCANVYSAMPYWPFQTMQQPGIPSGAIGTVKVALMDLGNLATNYSSVLHPWSSAVLGVPVYLIIANQIDDAGNCISPATTEASYQSIFSQAHADGDIVVAATSNATQLSQLFCNTALQYWFTVQQWLPLQGKTAVSGTATWDILTDINAVVNDGANSSLVAGNSGLAPAGARLASMRLGSDLVAGSGIPGNRWGWWYGQEPAASGSNFNGYMFTPSVDGPNTFAITDAAQSEYALEIDTMHHPGYVYLGNAISYGSNLYVSAYGHSHFGPVLVVQDTDSSPITPSKKEVYITDPFSPTGNSANNSIIESIGASGAPSVDNRVTTTAGEGFDFGYNYNSNSVFTVNSAFINLWGDAYDSLHAAWNGSLCVHVNPIEAGSGQQGCPGAGVFSVGTTAQMQVDGSGNTTVQTVAPASARRGTFTCTGGGNILISNSNFVTGSDVTVTMETSGGTPAQPFMNTPSSGVSFKEQCGASDTSTYRYTIWN